MKKVLAVLLFGSAFANPQGATVVHGSAELSQPAPHQLCIHASDKAVIHWKEFSIGEQETTRFIQPDSSASVLNRVTGDRVSSILGNLDANGQVFLINPMGIWVGKEGHISTGAWIASSLDLLDDDFLEGKLLFQHTGLAGAVANEGTVDAYAGDIAMFGAQVDNKGSLSAPSGGVFLGAGQEIYLKPEGEERVFIKMGGPSWKEKCGVVHEGSISASTVEIKSDGSFYDLAIRIDGDLLAESKRALILLEGRGGLCEVSGNWSAKNEDGSGGSVTIFADKIALHQANIDLSGESKGGEFHLEGQFAYVSPETIVDIGAKGLGNGGTAYIWADELTQFYGSIIARGGEIGGDGGFVEVSAQSHLDYKGIVDLRPFQGNYGSLLLDPEADITIQAAGATSGTFNALAPFTYTPAAPADILTTADLIAQLGMGNVTVQTTYPGPAGVNNGRITLIDDLAYPSATTLTLLAAEDVHILATLESLAGGAIQLTGQNVFIGPSFNAGTASQVRTSGAISMTALAGDIQLLGGPGAGELAQIDLQGPSSLVLTASQDVALFGGGDPTSTALIQASSATPVTQFLINAGRDMTMTATVGDAEIDAQASSLSILAGRNFTMIGTATSSAEIQNTMPTTLSINAGNDFLMFDSVISWVDQVLVFAGNNVELTTNFTTTVIAMFGGTLPCRIEAGNDVILNGLNPPFDTGAATVGGAPRTFEVIAGRNIEINDNGTFFNASGGDLTLVVDNDFPTAPGIGPGAFIYNSTGGGGGNVSSTGPLRIFTAIRANNQILSPINNATFVPGPLFANSATEQWGVYYFNAFFGGPAFTIFYKESQAILTALAQPIFVTAAEMFVDLHPYDEYLPRAMDFTSSYERVREYIGSYDFGKNLEYMLARRTQKSLPLPQITFSPFWIME